MIEQPINIIIINSSEIILSGLSYILKDAVNANVIAIDRIDELINYPHLSGYVLLITTSEMYQKSSTLIIKVLSTISEIKLLFFVEHQDDALDLSSIGLFETKSMIQMKVNNLLDQFSKSVIHEENNELTHREKEVLRLVAKGISNKEIAQNLNISTHTIISHRKNICEKIGIRSASGLTMYAVLKKIIKIDEINTSELI